MQTLRIGFICFETLITFSIRTASDGVTLSRYKIYNSGNKRFLFVVYVGKGKFMLL